MVVSFFCKLEVVEILNGGFRQFNKLQFYCDGLSKNAKNQKIQLCKWLKCVVTKEPKCKKTRLRNQKIMKSSLVFIFKLKKSVFKGDLNSCIFMHKNHFYLSLKHI